MDNMDNVERNEDFQQNIDQLENIITVSKEKEKHFLIFVENLKWSLNYLQYKALEIHSKLNK